MRKTNNIKKFRDCQTRDAAVAPVEGLHDGLEFEYRPMLGEDAEDLQVEVGRSSGAEGYRKICTMLADRIVEWSEPVKVDFQAVRELPYKITLAAHRIVSGLQPSDPLSDESGDERRLYDELKNDTPESQLKK